MFDNNNTQRQTIKEIEVNWLNFQGHNLKHRSNNVPQHKTAKSSGINSTHENSKWRQNAHLLNIPQCKQSNTDLPIHHPLLKKGSNTRSGNWKQWRNYEIHTQGINMLNGIK